MTKWHLCTKLCKKCMFQMCAKSAKCARACKVCEICKCKHISHMIYIGWHEFTYECKLHINDISKCMLQKCPKVCFKCVQLCAQMWQSVSWKCATISYIIHDVNDISGSQNGTLCVTKVCKLDANWNSVVNRTFPM